MSGMATEIAARMAAEAEGQAAGRLPGNEGGTSPQAAEPSNTDTGDAGTSVPDTIPYSRFKEVNDRYNDLKGFESLRTYGYDPDSLGRLAAFEATYQSDPIGTWAAMADNLDLPQAIKDQIASHLSAGGTDPAGSAQGAPSSNDDAPRVELPADVVERLAYVDQLKAEREASDQTAQLNRVMAAWDSMDTQDSVKTPERIKLMAISSTAGGGQQFQTIEELAKAARDSIMEFRGEVLGDAVIGTGIGAPPSLPGSLPAPTGPVKFTSIKDASKAAEAALIRGDLPGTGA